MSLATTAAPHVPAAALAAMEHEDFAELVKASIGREADPVVWDALTAPEVIARTKAVLGGIHADVQSQLNLANTDLQRAKAEGYALGADGRQSFFAASADQAEWRARAIGFRRLVEQRLYLVKARTPRYPQAQNQPTGSRIARLRLQDALEQLARAVTAHRDKVTSGEGGESDDDALWALLDEITVTTLKGGELPLEEWLEWLDEVREQERAERA